MREVLRLLRQKTTWQKPKLNDEQMAKIKDALLKPAAESGYYVWNDITLSDYIKETYDCDVELSVRQCQHIFNLWQKQV